MLVCTADGRVLCIKPSGKVSWMANLKSSPRPNLYVADIDGDVVFEVVVATQDGYAFCTRNKKF